MSQQPSLPPARRAALHALTSTFAGQDAQAAVDRAITKFALQDRDRALTTELVYGHLRLKGRADFILSKFLSNPKGLPEELRLAMGLAAHEILFLSRIPAYASVSWCVNLTKELGLGKLGGVANAVLRKVSRLGDEVHEAAFYADPRDEIRSLARYHAAPEWIVKLWVEAYGRTDAEHYLRAQMLPPALGVSIDFAQPGATDAAAQLAEHPALMDRDGFGFAFPAGTRLDTPTSGTPLMPGSFAARQAVMALDPASWPEPVWDACSGRGGKTRILAELGKDVLASDVHRGRIRALQAQLPDIYADERSVLDGPVHGLQPGTILLDAPCTGLGVLSRRPDTKHKRTPGDAANLVTLQAEMLDAAWNALKPGGRLAYVTCTLNPAENQDQVASFLDRCPDASLRVQWATPPDSALGEFFYSSLIDKTIPMKN